ncbi:effector-associated domain EAD1-containing protein [Sorangium sp. So ce385]|uniref:effector-associated domain EAD1-containing protein n=1 Tax=Sorangium sp. So ce385 TaxID=3133308 RepID=UPI003F5C1909
MAVPPRRHFLDAPSFDWSQPASEALLRTLSAAYPTLKEAQFLAATVGIDLADVAVHPTLRLTWMSLIEVAHLAKKLRPLLEKVASDPMKAAVHEQIRALLRDEPAR